MTKFNYELDYSRIKELRIKNNLKQTDLAKLLNISFQSYSRYENMERIIPITKLNTIANYYNVTLDYLVKLTNQKSNKNIINKDINKTIIAQRIKELRTKYNLYQETLAMDIGTSKSFICEFEKEKKLLSLQYAYAICKKYNLSLDYTFLNKTYLRRNI